MVVQYVGTDNGEIGVIVNKAKFILIQEKAHNKKINCIEFINYKPNLSEGQGDFDGPTKNGKASESLRKGGSKQNGINSNLLINERKN